MDSPEILDIALHWSQAGHQTALATVVRTSGSSPRPAGSQLIVRDDMEMAGSVSGGCVEAAVIESAREVIASGQPALLAFHASDETPFAVGLACGGAIEILVEPLCSDYLASLQTARQHKQGVAVVTHLSTARHDIIRDDIVRPRRVGHETGRSEAAQILQAAAREALRTDRAQILEADGERYFVHPFNPPLRLLLIGAVHIAQALVPMARSCGYQVCIIDPRKAFASAERFPDVELQVRWPAPALAELDLDGRTALVALSHDPKIDDPALCAALTSPCFYVGALGSRRTHAQRLERLHGQGLAAEELGRIRGPVGLAIGARSPGEIAVSILAQITECLRS